MEKRCVLCSKPVDLELSPKTNLKNIVNYLYSKEKFELAERIYKEVFEELTRIRNSYKIKIKYNDGISDVPLCKTCFRELVKKVLKEKAGLLGSIDNTII